MMKADPLSRIADRIAAAKAAIDAEFAPLVRNHLVQLFRKAHAKDHGLEGLNVGMGSAVPKGHYLLAARDDEGNIATARALDWSYGGGAPMYQEVADFFTAAEDYTDRLCGGRVDDLPDIGDITLDDLESRAAKRAR